MMRRRRQPSQPTGAPKWMVTFSDLITLILVFFILLFSMSQIDIVKFRTIADSFQQRQILEFYPSVIPFENPSAEPEMEKEKTQPQSSEETDKELNQLLAHIQSYLNENKLSDVVVATRTERGVVLVLQEQALFASGEATVLEDAYPFLNKVGDLLSRIPNFVKVEGHTDNRPIGTYRFPSNWELSSARASSVIRYLVQTENLDPKRFIAVGYGDTRPIAPNDTSENLQKNRRVEVIITDPAYEEQ
ncbi:flagellar motor protein MotS [Rossellomorea aquimaris]|uniref:Flagellar motor protein MotB n=1 Tax=Rossellomorea aquimaris TaxID=189382 RepID=A0A5D4U0B5_9BACI|nr:flagellar motor protein MotS [Rossellomorea aquimaris]TYS75342.1 flagellar motor protein MotB [Rossellomorea aquimaris]TYS80641.1 flagellar motor protein MotB [Rossellomorea aquimaris]